jgi:hypothetical protein
MAARPAAWTLRIPPHLRQHCQPAAAACTVAAKPPVAPRMYSFHIKFVANHQNGLILSIKAIQQLLSFAN